MMELDAGNIITLALVVISGAIAWGASKKSAESHSKSIEKHEARHEEHDRNFAKVFSLMAAQNEKQLERELLSERALNDKLQDVKSSVSKDIKIAVDRIDLLMASVVSNMTTKDK